MNHRGAAVLKVLFQVHFGHCLLDKTVEYCQPATIELYFTEIPKY